MDKIIEQQATHYGLTVDQFTDLMSDAAAYQEYVEYFGEDDEYFGEDDE